MDEQKKTIDERLEALTMNLELMAHTVEANRVANEQRFTEMDKTLEKIMSSLEKLLTIAHSHERRIAGLDGLL